MSTNPEARFHFTAACCWIGGVVCLCLAIVVTSGECQSLARRRGQDFNERKELAAQQEHLRAETDWLSSRPVLELAVVRIGLSISPPQRFAVR